MGIVLADITGPLDKARQQWHSWYALILAEIASVTVVTRVAVTLALSSYGKVLLYLAAMALTGSVWALSRRLPRTRKGKVGFVISIASGVGADPSRIREDFVVTLHELLKAGESGRSFHVIAVPEHVAHKVVDVDDAQELCRRCRGHFVIYGRVRPRKVAGKDEHVLHLNGLVVHKPIPVDASKSFSKEFSELLPRRVLIPVEDDVLGFHFTSEWISCVAKYVIGIAAACSGDLDYAERLFKDTQENLQGKAQAVPVYAVLKRRVPNRLATICFLRAALVCRRWSKTRDMVHMDEVGRRLASIPRAQANAYEVVLLRAVYLFVRDRNVRAALAARALRSGVGLAKLRELVVAQGGDPRVIDEPSLLTKGAAFLPVSLDASGYVSSIDARQIGEIVRELKSAAGERKCLCGVLVEKKVGDGIGAGEAVAAVVVPDAVPAEAVERAKGEVCGAFRVSDARPRRQRLLAAVVGGGTGTAHHPQMNTDER